MRSLPPLLASALALAGCLGATPTTDTPPLADLLPLPQLLCVADLCNYAATVDPPERQANELSVAVNPLDRRNIIATGKDYNPGSAGDCTYAALYATKDGGLTWKNVNLPGSPWTRLNDPTEPLTDFSKYWCVTDPVVAFGADGTAYWTVMPYQCDAASGSKVGRGVIPGSPVTGGGGGLNDWMWTCSAMYVLVSGDGGETWPTIRKVAEGPRLTHDKQWIAVAPDARTVLLCWDYSSQTFVADDTPAGPVLGQTSVVCSVSKDKGDTWTAHQPIGHDGFYPWIEYDADGRAWMTLLTGFFEGDVIVLSSADGVAWDPPVKVASFKNAGHRNDHGWPALEGSQFRIVPVPSLAVDRSDGPHRGSVYVAYFDWSSEKGEVYLVASRDGTTWNAPVRLADDATGADKFLPVVSVGPDGVVDVSWYDRRDDPANHLFDVYYAYSIDGGVTFSENLRVTDVSSDEKWSHHQNGMIFLGDYRDSDSVAGAATLVWVDTRNEKADAFVATLLRGQ